MRETRGRKTALRSVKHTSAITNNLRAFQFRLQDSEKSFALYKRTNDKLYFTFTYSLKYEYGLINPTGLLTRLSFNDTLQYLSQTSVSATIFKWYSYLLNSAGTPSYLHTYENGDVTDITVQVMLMGQDRDEVANVIDGKVDGSPVFI